MSHETYLTTHDKTERLLHPRGAVAALLWAGATAALAVTAVASSGILMLGLGLASAYTGYKTVENMMAKTHSHQAVEMTSHSSKDDLKELDDDLQQARLASGRAPAPPVIEDTEDKSWRAEMAQQAKDKAVRHANRGA